MRALYLATTTALALALAACGSPSGTANASGSAEPSASAEASTVSAAGTKFTLADGPDVCFRQITAQLGKDVKVAEIVSFFSSGSEIDSDEDDPAGQMTVCTVQYQNPTDARKLLSRKLDLTTGQFADPVPVEISVSGGDAKNFRLEDSLIPLSQVNAAALTTVMDAQQPALSKAYSKYAWSGVRLEAPGAFDATHKLRLDVDGRLAANDIKESGYASIDVGGRKVTRNLLLP